MDEGRCWQRGYSSVAVISGGVGVAGTLGRTTTDKAGRAEPMNADRFEFKAVAQAGSTGEDGESLNHITATPETQARWLDALQTELKAQTYRPAPVRRVHIPKSSGGQRPLGIPTVKDRVVQMAVLLVLGPIYEADWCATPMTLSSSAPLDRARPCANASPVGWPLATSNSTRQKRLQVQYGLWSLPERAAWKQP